MSSAVDIYELASPEQARSVFEAAGDLNLQIIDQNHRFKQAGEVFVDEPEILAIAEASIAEEQQETFTDLVEHGRGSGEIYAAIGGLTISLERELAEANTEIDDAVTQASIKTAQVEALKVEREAAEKNKYDDVLGNVELLAPKALEKVQALLEERLRGSVSDNEEIRNLEDEILRHYMKQDENKEEAERLLARRDTISEVFEQGAEAWELPQALIKVHGTDMKQWIILDELPVEPKLNPSGHDRFTALRDRHVDQPQATVYAALYLSDHSGETVTVDDLASFLYTEETVANLSDYNMRSRITTLLGPIAGEQLHSTLLEEGYILQYGWRRFLEKNGDDKIRIKTRHRIYRAVSLRDVSILAKETDPADEEGVSDVFDVTPEIAKLVSVYRQEHAATHPDDTESNGSAERQPKWVRGFRKQVNEVLESLEELNLLTDEEGQLLKVARAKTNSRVFGTEDTITKLQGAGYLKHLGFSVEQWAQQVITPSEMIIMHLFNTRKELLGKGQPQRQRAIAVVEESVANYFDNKRAREKEAAKAQATA